MNDKQDIRSLVSFAISAALAAGAATAQVAGDTGIDASGDYQAELAACRQGHTPQDVDTCLREARNAAAEKRRGKLATAGELKANAMARCNVHQDAEDRAACEARVMGMGITEGSVAGGGVLRTVETVVLPPGQEPVKVVPQTPSEPVILVPGPGTTAADRFFIRKKM